MRKLLVLFALLNGLLATAQSEPLNAELTQIVEKIANTNELLSQAIGYGGTPTEQYERFRVLKQKASIKQLKALTDHENPVVRCYAFWGLSDRQADGLFEILKDRIDDNAEVSRTFGCVGSKVSVVDFYIELLTRDFLITEDYYRENYSYLNPEEKKELDDLVLHSASDLAYLDQVLYEHQPSNEADYTRIRTLVLKKKLQALPALARYQKEEDVELIMSFTLLEDKPNMYPHPKRIIFEAMEAFPHEDFIPFLLEFGEGILSRKGFSSYWFQFYSACAKYNTPETLEVLSRPVLDTKADVPMRKYHLRFISYALGKYPSPENRELIIALWKDYKKIQPGSFNYLKEADPDTTFEILKLYTSDFEETYTGDDEQELIPVIMPFALAYDREEAIRIITTNLASNSITPFREWADIAKELKARAFIEPLFDRIETAWNFHVKWEAVRVLLAYHDDELNKRLLEAINNTLDEGKEYKSIQDLYAAIAQWNN